MTLVMTKQFFHKINIFFQVLFFIFFLNLKWKKLDFYCSIYMYVPKNKHSQFSFVTVVLNGVDFSPVASFCQSQTWLVLNQTAQKKTVHYMFTVFLYQILTEAGEIIIIISMFDHFLSMVSFSSNFLFAANLNDVNVSLMSFFNERIELFYHILIFL